MKCFKYVFIILVIFIKTGNVLSNENIFNVNNIEVIKKGNLTNQQLTNLAIKRGFKELAQKIFLEKDFKKLSQLNFSQIKGLVKYYQVDTDTDERKINYNIFFDKDKLHKLFYDRGILYSEIFNKELYTLPIFKDEDEYYIYSKNFFYDRWNDISNNDLIEFILPLENIEVIQKINANKNDLLGLNFNNLFTEYSSKNLALILIEDRGLKEEKIFLKTRIVGKEINKNILVKRENLDKNQFYEKIISEIKKELETLVKSQNLIDVRTPSFLNTKFLITKQNNLIELNKRLKNIGLIENIFVQEFNNEYVYLKIKYLGKLDKMINQLKNQKIILKLINDQWSLKII